MNLVNLAVAFGAGLISITSPCCLPLLPGYLGYLTGLSSGDLEANRGRILSAALLFVVGLLSRGGDWSRWSAGGKLWTAPVLGAAFAITWTPCIGPVLGAVLTLAGTTAALSQGVALLAAY